MRRRVAADPIRRGVGDLASSSADTYTVRGEPYWWHFDPVSSLPLLRQGWKIHVSASVSDAPEVLRRVAAIVLPLGLRWKVARSLEKLMDLSSPPSPLTQSGKFITIYPDSSVLELASSLDTATREFSAPVVPSDRRFGPHSNVYLRYGAFSASSVFDPVEQSLRHVLVSPAGRRVEDKRAPGVAAPDWVDDLVPVAPRPFLERPGTGLFGREIVVDGVLRQSVKGGVFRVRYRGAPAVLKEARIGTTPDRLGRDSRTALRNEWDLLRSLSGTGLAPEPLAFFHQEDNAYLVQEFLPGRTLRAEVERLNYRSVVSPTRLVELLFRVHQLVGSVESYGVRLLDLTPNNIMVDGSRLAVIDLEHAGLVDSPEPPFVAHTPGYVPPSAPWAASTEYALAAIDHYVLTGIDPFLGRDVRYADHLPAVLRAFAPIDLEPTVLDDIWRNLGTATPSMPSGADRVVEEAVEAGEELVKLTEWDRHPWPWPQRWAPGSMHPASFMAGTTGIARYYLDLWEATGDRAWLHHTDELLTWTVENNPVVPGQTPPGLYFGLGALPWLMTDLAQAGHEPELWLKEARRRSDEMNTIEVHGHDITHGWAGIGLTKIALHQATNEGDEEIRAIIAKILSGVQTQDGLPAWPNNFHGFAHGSAGIAYFLLHAGRAVDDPVAIDLAIATGKALLSQAIPAGEGLSWQHKPGQDTVWSHWCNGAAGVGILLNALATHTGDEELKQGARQAGRAITTARPFGSTCRCHGLAGDGDFLLDLDEPEFHDGAVHIGRKLDALRFRQGFAVKWAPEGLGAPRPDYMRGYTGVHAFRLRLAGYVARSPLTLRLEEK
ncbi:lanthionine synthetase LanC family protein [Lentzea sp. NPDC051838]|uniref:class III lanthionine synthetase LanKC N-terminal domain-containing protein n=1 Tax=Lentzea sp. NPDC051838 TaxID=3154849 RepID=UPI00343A3606